MRPWPSPRRRRTEVRAGWCAARERERETKRALAHESDCWPELVRFGREVQSLNPPVKSRGGLEGNGGLSPLALTPARMGRLRWSDGTGTTPLVLVAPGDVTARRAGDGAPYAHPIG